ncbi:hypothetical protein I5I61_18685 [Pseudomonas nitroreducens]|uniref:Uncharacterized protein n=1 Tax=Pseudomonas nitroreducens TaxID=46680 RepID=A0ABS0KN06_PSENT|nr:hypothetical protein [Pseudomonas nitroreducens]MBG6289485.1 hypothetical protein [Pseudomonas nitroreducens]
MAPHDMEKEMAAHDRNMLTKQQISQFKVWLDKNGITWREGKGEFELIQVKLSRGWLAIFTNASGVVTTPVQFREMIAAFKKGQPYGGHVKVSQGEPSAFLEDLRDDFAMRAMVAMIGHYSANGAESICQQYAEIAGEAYRVADAMLAARTA